MKKSLVVVGIALGLTACSLGSSDSTPAPGEPKEPSGEITGGEPSRAATPGPAPEAVPKFVRGECGSIEPRSATVSSDRSKATPVSHGQLVGARIDPSSQANREHFWSADLRAGAYLLVLDSKTADGKTNNVGLAVQRLDGRGNEEETLLRGNEIARRYRDLGFFQVASDGVVQFKVRGVFDMEDYVLGIFSNGTPVPSPYFTDCPTITPLALDKPEAFKLASPGSPGDEQWFSVELDSGDFSFRLGATQATRTNLQYHADLLDRLGQWGRAKRLLSANEIDTSFQAEGTHVVGEKTPFWLRVRNKHSALEMNVTVSKQ